MARNKNVDICWMCGICGKYWFDHNNISEECKKELCSKNE